VIAGFEGGFRPEPDCISVMVTGLKGLISHVLVDPCPSRRPVHLHERGTKTWTWGRGARTRHTRFELMTWWCWITAMVHHLITWPYFAT
jgi:hypothetical protein